MKSENAALTEYIPAGGPPRLSRDGPPMILPPNLIEGLVTQRSSGFSRPRCQPRRGRGSPTILPPNLVKRLVADNPVAPTETSSSCETVTWSEMLTSMSWADRGGHREICTKSANVAEPRTPKRKDRRPARERMGCERSGKKVERSTAEYTRIRAHL